MDSKRRKLGVENLSIPIALAATQNSTLLKEGAWSYTRRAVQLSFPASLTEREFRCPNIDKAFACEWQDDRYVFVGTKCNALLRVDTASGTFTKIPRPDAPQRDFSTENRNWGSCGIHAVTSNFAKDMLVTGGSDPADAVVLSLPDFKPLVTCVGHRDWVFGLAWVTDRHFVSGSRDGALAVWHVDDTQQEHVVQRKDYENKLDMKRKFEPLVKIREVKYDKHTGRLAAMLTNSSVKIMDPARDFTIINTIHTPQALEQVCMAYRTDLVATGSIDSVTLADPRLRKPVVKYIKSPDGNQGVRSVTIHNDLASFGTGKGKLCFYDMRADDLLPVDVVCGTPAPRPAPAAQLDWQEDVAAQPVALPRSFQFVIQPAQRRFLSLGAGFVDVNSEYTHYFGMTPRAHACYAHVWSPCNRRLFVCGGPLAFGMKGNYLAVWE